MRPTITKKRFFAYSLYLCIGLILLGCQPESKDFNENEERYIKQVMQEYNTLLKTEFSDLIVDFKVENEKKLLLFEKRQLDMEEAFEKMRKDISSIDIKLERGQLKNKEDKLSVYTEQKKLLNKLQELENRFQAQLVSNEQAYKELVAEADISDNRISQQVEKRIAKKEKENLKKNREPIIGNIVVSKTKITPPSSLGQNKAKAGMLSKARKGIEADCKEFLAETTTITLEPKEWLELKSAYVYTNNCGKLDVELRSERGVQKMQMPLVKGKSPIDFTDMSAFLEPAIKYELVLTPIEGNEYCKTKKIVELENISKCSKPLDSEGVIDISYDGNVVLYDLRFVY